MLGPAEALLIVFPLAFAIFLGIGISRVGRDLEPDGWATNHGLVLNERTNQTVVDYLTRSRRLRLIGALIGLVVPFGINIPGIEMMAGYLVGALYAEFTQPRLQMRETAAAALSPRALADYLPGWVPTVLRALGGSGLGLLALFLFGPERANQAVDYETAVIIAGGIATAIVAVVIELLLRRMAARSQPAASPELLKVDDAIRSASMHAAAGAGIGVTALLVGALLWSVGVTSDIQFLRWTFPVLAAGCGFMAIGTWIALGPGTPWTVKRNLSTLGVTR